MINRTPSVVLENQSPYLMLYGKDPDLSYMRDIVCLCYATTLPKQDKFAERAINLVGIQVI